MERQAHVVTSREVISEVECGKVCDVFVRSGDTATYRPPLEPFVWGNWKRFQSVEFKSIDRVYDRFDGNLNFLDIGKHSVDELRMNCITEKRMIRKRSFLKISSLMKILIFKERKFVEY